MNRHWRSPLLLAIGALLLAVLYWLLPIRGQLAYLPPTDGNTVANWPQIAVAVDRADLLVHVQDVTPWTHVRLEMGTAETTLIEHGAQNAVGMWQWRWRVTSPDPQATIALYHSCQTGCQTWTVQQTAVLTPNPPHPPQTPTKLGVVFADPTREWYGRQGWTVEITYAQLAEEFYWGIDDLAQRVQQAAANGLRPLVRVEYAQGQSVPPSGDYAALDSYLTYLRRLARDDRLQPVHAFIIGSNMNSNGVTPAWYAQLFNGYGTEPLTHSNAIETVRSQNSQVRVLVGPVSPWHAEQNGDIPFDIDQPWLNYMNTLVAFLNDAAAAKTAVGISDTAPDGFAIQAFGRVNALQPNQRATEPLQDVHVPQWGAAQAGFRIYQDWLTIINRYPFTQGKPVYINASNTFDTLTGQQPAENYAAGWLTNALQAVNNEPQIVALCWFIDSFPHDDQWELFSLSDRRGLLDQAANEFDKLLQQPGDS